MRHVPCHTILLIMTREMSDLWCWTYLFNKTTTHFWTDVRQLPIFEHMLYKQEIKYGIDCKTVATETHSNIHSATYSNTSHLCSEDVIPHNLHKIVSVTLIFLPFQWIMFLKVQVIWSEVPNFMSFLWLVSFSFQLLATLMS